MDFYAHICKNGDVLIVRNPLLGQEFCEKCGAEMLDKCPSCQSIIREWYYPANCIGKPKYERAAYCHKCGKPYPWTVAALESSAALIEEDEELNNELREKVIETLPTIITETPKTNLAVVLLKKVFASAGRFTADSLRQFAIDFGCELAKKKSFDFRFRRFYRSYRCPFLRGILRCIAEEIVI